MKEVYNILNRWSCKTQVIVEIEYDGNILPSMKLGLAVKAAIAKYANLLGTDLRYADLRYANLRDADLRGADLQGANLRSANLRGADLQGANLQGTDLRGANLRYADLRGANLQGADLRGADLQGTDLRSANLRYANLRDADLRGADLRYAKNSELGIAQTRILSEGSIIGWKKCMNDVIVKLRIPEEAKRSHAFGRKCRAEYADVLEIIGSDVAVSLHDGKTEYRVGKRVFPDSFSDDWQTECASGIHFFITRIEAENYR